jgi:hypothetical protein
MGLALLPLGVITAGLVVLRVALLVVGWEPFDSLDALWVLVFSGIAASFVRSGREFRRTSN